MSSASKSDSNGKSNQRDEKERSEVEVKPSHLPSAGGNGSIGSADTFQFLEKSSLTSLSAPQDNDRFRTTDNPVDKSKSSSGTTVEYDSVSNNINWSGESEDLKEKPTSDAPSSEAIAGCDSDKKDNTRQKNERKHQRQKERRALELHDRCTGLLQSRKLIALSNQLVAMGFSADRASKAIIKNEGRMEDSVAWLLQEDVENNQQVVVDSDDRSRIKIDIADELSRIDELGVKYKCTKQEVERAVVACEGDLLKANESLRVQNLVNKAAAKPKSDESAYSIWSSNKVAAHNQCSVPTRYPGNGAAAAACTQKEMREERDFNYMKSMAFISSLQESADRDLQQSLNRIWAIQPNPAAADWSWKQSSTADKQWLTTETTAPVLHLWASQTLVSGPVRPESWFGLTIGHDVNASSQTGVSAEPLDFIICRKQNLHPQSPGSGSSPAASTRCYPSIIPSSEVMEAENSCLDPNLSSTCLGCSTMQQLYPKNSQPTSSGPTDSSALLGWLNHLNATGGTSSFLATPSSLGLFTNWGSLGSSNSSSQNEWSLGGLMPKRDYASIDWSLH